MQYGTAAVLAAVGLVAGGATVAQAACTPPMAPVFQAYGDANLYVQVPGADFETAAPGWTLSKARVVADAHNGLGGADSWTLQVDAGGYAVSPAFCVTQDFRGVRLFHRVVGASSGRYTVDLLYKGRAVSTSAVQPTGTWSLSSSLRVLNVAGALPAGTEVPVALRFRPISRVAVQIDDVYVDPRMR